MLEIVDLTYRIAGRTLFDAASASIADGWKVGLVGRNGTGKSTLLRLILEEAAKPSGAVRVKKGARIGFVAQEIAATDEPLLEVVLAADEERARLMAEAETAEDPDRIGEIHSRLADIDAYAADSRASAILIGLGFSQDDLARPARAFSGGWRMRAALAGVLFSGPELLILDEPTNYLDLEGAAWLEAYLRKYPGCVLVVSHDRELLNRSVTHILALDNLKLEVHPGGYDSYMRRRAERAALAGALKGRQDAERARLQAFVDRFRAKASKARQAQSRVKMLEKMQTITVPLEDRTAPFNFPDPDERASPLVTLDEADLGYLDDTPVLGRVSFRLDADDRIGIIGPNGQGKTTLVKSLAGRLALLAGQRTAARALKIGYFSQDQLDELRPGESVLAHIRDAHPTLTPAAHRSIAAQIGFGAEKVETAVDRLSGGEKVRLLLGLIAQAKPHVLVLDEPTSHLDIDSREALVHALNAYAGALLLITHDVYLAEACVERLWLVHGGRARPYDGDLDAYRALVLAADRPRESGPGGKTAPAKAQAPPPTTTTPIRTPPARSSSASGSKAALARAEKALAEAQVLLERIDRALADPQIYAKDPARAADLTRQRTAAAAALAAAEEAWLAASG